MGEIAFSAFSSSSSPSNAFVKAGDEDENDDEDEPILSF